MNPCTCQRTRQQFAAVLTATVLLNGAVISWFLFARPAFPRPIVKIEQTVTPDEIASDSTDTSSAALSQLNVQLNPELFPKPGTDTQTADTPSPPAPSANLTLLAVIRKSHGLAIFVRDTVTGVYQELAIGERAVNGALVQEIGFDSARFVVDGETITVEMPQ